MLLVFIASFFSYKKYFLERDYLITAEVACDPKQEICFVGHCDTEIEECEEEVFYYKKIEGKAKSLPDCDPNYDDCPLLWCGEEGNNACINVHCGVDDECSSPEDFRTGIDENKEDESEVLQEDAENIIDEQ